MLIAHLVALTVASLPFAVYGQNEEAPVPSICDPLMPLALYESYSKIKDLCICIADKDYDACTSKSGDGDASGKCGVAQCQDYNECEITNICAQTAPPGIQILDCSTTIEKFPPLPVISRMLDRQGLTDGPVTDCVQEAVLPDNIVLAMTLISEAYNDVNP